MASQLVTLRFCHEAAQTQDVSIPAVQATALVYGETYTISRELADALLRQGGWQPVEAAGRKGKAEKVPEPGVEPGIEPEVKEEAR